MPLRFVNKGVCDTGQLESGSPPASLMDTFVKNVILPDQYPHTRLINSGNETTCGAAVEIGATTWLSLQYRVTASKICTVQIGKLRIPSVILNGRTGHSDPTRDTVQSRVSLVFQVKATPMASI